MVHPVSAQTDAEGFGALTIVCDGYAAVPARLMHARLITHLLVMTRTTGGRGLDLPFAHYAVFYSPKSDPVTMWQEMSRIRSTVSTPKDIHVLCYGETEGAKLCDLVAILYAQGRRVSCTVLDVI